MDEAIRKVLLHGQPAGRKAGEHGLVLWEHLGFELTDTFLAGDGGEVPQDASGDALAVVILFDQREIVIQGAPGGVHDHGDGHPNRDEEQVNNQWCLELEDEVDQGAFLGHVIGETTFVVVGVKVAIADLGGEILGEVVADGCLKVPGRRPCSRVRRSVRCCPGTHRNRRRGNPSGRSGLPFGGRRTF